MPINCEHIKCKLVWTTQYKMSVWSKIAKYGKRVFVAVATAFTGYEIGSNLDSEEKIIHRETTVIQRDSGSIENFVAIAVLLVFIAIIFGLTHTAIKCVIKNRNTNSASANINVEAANQTQQPAPVRRQQ